MSADRDTAARAEPLLVPPPDKLQDLAPYAPVLWVRMRDGKVDWAEDCVASSKGELQILDYPPEDNYEAVPLYRRLKIETAPPAKPLPDSEARVLREANGKLAQENHDLRMALRFYANGWHAALDDEWEAPEEPNWLCPPLEIEGEEPQRGPWSPDQPPPKKLTVAISPSWMVEDGSIAAQALRGKKIDWKGDSDNDEPPPPIEGEAEYEIAALATAPGIHSRDYAERLAKAMVEVRFQSFQRDLQPSDIEEICMQFDLLLTAASLVDRGAPVTPTGELAK